LFRCGAYLDTNDAPNGEKNISARLSTTKNNITQRILAFWVSGAPTPRLTSVNAKIPKVTPNKNNAIDAFLYKLQSPCGRVASLYHNAPRTGPKTIQVNALVNFNHEYRYDNNVQKIFSKLIILKIEHEKNFLYTPYK